MPESRKTKKSKLFDVEVDTVGLVSEGANREHFFLLKSKGEDNTDSHKEDIMPEDTKDQKPNVDTEELEQQIDEKVGKSVMKFLRDAFGSFGKGEEDTPPAEPQPEEEAIQEQLDKIEKLQEAQDLMKQELEEAKEEARKEREAREKQEYLEKANTLAMGLPVEAEALADDLVAIRKVDAELADRFEALLSAVNEQQKEAGLFEEIGTTETPTEPNSVVEKIEAKAKEEGKDIKDVLLELSKEEADRYLQAQRNE
jgi:hypothetical protein